MLLARHHVPFDEEDRDCSVGRDLQDERRGVGVDAVGVVEESRVEFDDLPHRVAGEVLLQGPLQRILVDGLLEVRRSARGLGDAHEFSPKIEVRGNQLCSGRRVPRVLRMNDWSATWQPARSGLRDRVAPRFHGDERARSGDVGPVQKPDLT